MHAFLYAGGVMKDIDTMNNTITTGYAINTAGVVVGEFEVAGPNATLEERAFIYSSGTMRDLNTLIPAGTGWVLEEATGINDAGQIVGLATTPGGATHAFLLQPN